MQEISIPRGEWASYLHSFSNQHRDWLVNVCFVEAQAGDEARAHQIALRSVELADAPAAGGAILVRAGRLNGGEIVHTLREPTDVRVVRRDDGVDQALRLASRGGAHLVLEFLHPQAVEAVDGVLS